MTEHIKWHWHDTDDDILYAKYHTGWTWDEHHTIIDEMLAARPNDRFIYVLVDLTDAPFPKGASITAQHRKIPDKALILLATDNTFVRIMSDMSIRVRGESHLYEIVSNVEKAYEAIERHRNERKTQLL